MVDLITPPATTTKTIRSNCNQLQPLGPERAGGGKSRVYFFSAGLEKVLSITWGIGRVRRTVFQCKLEIREKIGPYFFPTISSLQEGKYPWIRENPKGSTYSLIHIDPRSWTCIVPAMMSIIDTGRALCRCYLWAQFKPISYHVWSFKIFLLFSWVWRG